MMRGVRDEYKKGFWTVEEDRILMEYIEVHGKGKWNRIPQVTGLKRCGKSCRLRWINYLSPNIKKGDFSQEEEDLIIRLHNLLGNRWSLIARRVPGRTDNQVKNHWNTHLSKKLDSNLRRRAGFTTSRGDLPSMERSDARVPISSGLDLPGPSHGHVGPQNKEKTIYDDGAPGKDRGPTPPQAFAKDYGTSNSVWFFDEDDDLNLIRSPNFITESLDEFTLDFILYGP